MPLQRQQHLRCASLQSCRFAPSIQQLKHLFPLALPDVADALKCPWFSPAGTTACIQPTGEACKRCRFSWNPLERFSRCSPRTRPLSMHTKRTPPARRPCACVQFSMVSVYHGSQRKQGSKCLLKCTLKRDFSYPQGKRAAKTTAPPRS